MHGHLLRKTVWAAAPFSLLTAMLCVAVVWAWQRVSHAKFWSSIAPGQDNAAGALMLFGEVEQLAYALVAGSTLGLCLSVTAVAVGRRALGTTGALVNLAFLALVVWRLLL